MESALYSMGFVLGNRSYPQLTAIQGQAILTIRKKQRVKFSGRYWLYTNANIGLMWQESQDRTYIKFITVM